MRGHGSQLGFLNPWRFSLTEGDNNTLNAASCLFSGKLSSNADSSSTFSVTNRLTTGQWLKILVDVEVTDAQRTARCSLPVTNGKKTRFETDRFHPWGSAVSKSMEQNSKIRRPSLQWLRC